MFPSTILIVSAFDFQWFFFHDTPAWDAWYQTRSSPRQSSTISSEQPNFFKPSIENCYQSKWSVNSVIASQLRILADLEKLYVVKWHFRFSKCQNDQLWAPNKLLHLYISIPTCLKSIRWEIPDWVWWDCHSTTLLYMSCWILPDNILWRLMITYDQQSTFRMSKHLYWRSYQVWMMCDTRECM